MGTKSNSMVKEIIPQTYPLLYTGNVKITLVDYYKFIYSLSFEASLTFIMKWWSILYILVVHKDDLTNCTLDAMFEFCP